MRFGRPEDWLAKAAFVAGHHHHRHVSGADSWVNMELLVKSKDELFSSFLGLPNDISSHDTPGNEFSLLDPDRFQECFIEWRCQGKFQDRARVLRTQPGCQSALKCRGKTGP